MPPVKTGSVRWKCSPSAGSRARLKQMSPCGLRVRGGVEVRDRFQGGEESSKHAEKIGKELSSVECGLVITKRLPVVGCPLSIKTLAAGAEAR